MGNYSATAYSDYRNEGWSWNGGSTGPKSAWDNDDDNKYGSCPGNKGRAAVRFPIDISSGNIPDGATITSVTIKIRVRKTVADSKSVTVNVLSTDDTSRYTSRTLYPTQTFADYEVGTYTVDPVGKAWTKERLNRLVAQVFSHSVPPNDGVRVAKLWAVINFSVRPSVIVTSPSGTVASPSPTIAWTYTQEDGDLQKSAEYRVFTAATVGVAGFDPDTGTAAFASSVTGDVTSLTLPTALAPDTYYLYVRVRSVKNAVSAWGSRAFTLTGAAPGVPGGGIGGGIGGIGTGGGGGFERVIADTSDSNAYLTLRDGSNILSVQQASFESTADSLGYIGANATLAFDTTTAFQGVGSLKLTRISSGDMSATSTYEEIAPATAITVSAQVKAATAARLVNVSVLFYDDAFVEIPGSEILTQASDSTDTWTEISATGTTPGAVTDDTVMYARVRVYVIAPGASEVHNVDGVGLMYGEDSVWSHGGHMSRNLLSCVASDADDPIDTLAAEPWAAGNAASTYARVANSGTGADGSKMFKMTYVGTAPSISFVATGTAFSSTSAGTGYTLNKPAGVADGDLLVAYVTSDVNVDTVELPAGWTLVNKTQAGSGITRHALYVMMRDGLAADPATWVGNFPESANRRRAVVVAYRGAATVATQFPVESIKNTTSSSLTVQSPSLSNVYANSWRLAAWSFKDGSASTAGSLVADTSPPASVPPIAYVGKGANWWYGGSQASFTINKPSGVNSGDLMLAFGSWSGTATPTAPTGWTQVRRTVRTTGSGDDHSGSCTFVVWKRTAGGSEPSSWSAGYSGSGTPLMTQSVAYRNCDTAANQFIAENAGTAGDNSVNTPTVSNNDSKAWRISAFSFTTNYGNGTSSNEVVERADNKTDVGNHPDIQIGVYDSNGTISTGNHSRSGSVSGGASAWSGIGWIGIIKPATAPPAGSSQTERSDGGAFSASPASYGLMLGIYDTNGVAPTGSQSLYGTYAPSGGTVTQSAAAWMGFLIPGAPSTSGEVAASLSTPVDISFVSPEVLARSDGKVTYQASFLGSTAGQPFLKLFFYNGNELIATRVAPGQSFESGIWRKSFVTFDIPSGTTRIGCGVSASDRVVSDEVYFDRASIAFGSSSVWRRGTGRSEHPIFDVPVIEYNEDLGTGYGQWATLPGTERALLRYDQLTGLVTYLDQTLRPLSYRRYRAKTVSYGLAGDVFASNVGPESDEVSLSAAEWWLKDPEDSTKAMQLKVRSEVFGVNTASTAAVFQPLGADRPVVLTEGYKGDTFTITVIVDRFENARLRQMLNSRKTLYLQSNLDGAWWVRPVGDIGSDTLETYTRHEDPIRFVKLTFTEVDPE